MSLSTIESGRNPGNGLELKQPQTSWDLLKDRSEIYLSQHKSEGLPYALSGEIAEHVVFFLAGDNTRLLTAIARGQYGDIVDGVFPNGFKQDMESSTRIMDALIHASVSHH